MHFDKIVKVVPDLIICNKEENTREMVLELEKIAPVWVSDICSVDDSLEMIRRLGELLDVSEKASEIVNRIMTEKMLFEKFMIDKPRIKVAYLIWKDPYMAAGTDTFIHKLLELNNFENIYSRRRYPEVTVESMVTADLILLSSEPYPFKEKHVKELKESITAKIGLVDGEYFSWYGSRLQAAFQYFRTLHSSANSI